MNPDVHDGEGIMDIFGTLGLRTRALAVLSSHNAAGLVVAALFPLFLSLPADPSVHYLDGIWFYVGIVLCGVFGGPSASRFYTKRSLPARVSGLCDIRVKRLGIVPLVMMKVGGSTVPSGDRR